MGAAWERQGMCELAFTPPHAFILSSVMQLAAKYDIVRQKTLALSVALISAAKGERAGTS
jgi:hypothetical protein